MPVYISDAIDDQRNVSLQRLVQMYPRFTDQDCFPLSFPLRCVRGRHEPDLHVCLRHATTMHVHFQMHST